MTTHMLDELRNPGRPSVLFCGAGLSVGAVPAATKLYEQEHENVERKLNIMGAINHDLFTGVPKKGRLYAWADAVLDELVKRTEILPKLRFAEALGLLTDPRWWGMAEIDFRGNAPRHRVIARFAKEGLWCPRYFSKTQTGRYRTAWIVPVPMFVFFDLSMPVQAADLAIYCVNWGFRLPLLGMDLPAREEIAQEFGPWLSQLQYRGQGQREGRMFDSYGITFVPNPYGDGR